MTVSPHMYLMRLRNSSLPELACRLQQSLTLPYLNLLSTLGRQLTVVHEKEVDAIANLIMPDLFLAEAASFLDCNALSESISSSMVVSNKQQTGNLPKVDPAPMEEDIRLIWEPARLQQAVLLLVIAHQTPEPPGWKQAQIASKAIIFSWLKANPFHRGMHYTSAMECALRIPVFFTALKLIDGLNPDEYDLVLKAIYRHAWLISKRLSLYSSLGNHTIAEAVGLIFAGAIYKSTPEGMRWMETGQRLLTDELPHQILDDGGPAEQSLNYHRFVLDLYWLAMDFIQKNNLGAVHHWEKRVSAGEFFLNVFKDKHGAFPSIGDSDNGFAIAPGVKPARSAGKPLKESRTTFEHSGYSVIRGGKLIFTFDHGPLGMSPLYNHGHADALSITLSKNGHPLLVDPGTYRYNGVPEWRRYFKGTRAHNTVTIDDQDQALQETSFIWSKPYNSRLTTHEKEDGDMFFNALHDGYMRLKAPVRHQRSVLFFDQGNFLIKDRFIGAGIHCFQLNFHLHPNAVVAKEGKWWIVDNDGERAFLRLVEGDFQVVRGQKNPLMGWFSSCYGEKEPTGTLTFTRTGNAGSVVFTTAICTRLPIHSGSFEIKAGELERKIRNT